MSVVRSTVGDVLEHMFENLEAPMSRRYADTVEVRRSDGAPQQFLWRQRVYVVREVLGHWLEAGAWWHGDRARALLGTGSDSKADAADAAEGRHERELWRVEAAGGRGVGVGVYDLCRDGKSGRWTLRALD
jgi:hypothetical protein